MKNRLAFEDMWLSLQDYFDRLRYSPVVFPCCSKLILPIFERMVNLLHRAPYTISEANASLYLQSWPKMMYQSTFSANRLTRLKHYIWINIIGKIIRLIVKFCLLYNRYLTLTVIHVSKLFDISFFLIFEYNSQSKYCSM
jgi:hypothetical protein